MNPKLGYSAITSLSLALVFSCTSPEEKAEQVKLTNKIDTASYIIGLDYGISIREEEIDVNELAIYRGLLDGLNGNSLLTDSLKEKIIDTYNKELNNRRAEKEKALIDKNQSEGKAFMEMNRSLEGVIELPDGLQYKILKPGSGDSPSDEDRVKIHFRAMFTDRKVFDMTYDRGPAIVKVNELVPGLTEGIKMMKPGAIFELYIPPALAYGNQTFAEVIPGGSTLIYSIELIEIIKN